MPEVRIAGESPEYRTRRRELLDAEIALKDQRERVAEIRRRLPMGAPARTDYVFREGPADLSGNDPGAYFDTTLSQLFAKGRARLIVYHMMFEPDEDQGCPMCSMWVDGYNGIAPHLSQTVNFAIIAKAELAKLRSWGHRRGWGNLRLLSSHDNTFNRDFNVEGEDGQLPALSVFCRDKDGHVYHFYTTDASLEYRHHRGLDLFTPVWNLLDLLPEGRGDWMPRHFYA